MHFPLDPADDPEATAAGPFYIDAEGGRQVLSQAELHGRLSALMRSCEGCENVAVTETTKLDRPDVDGCNWSSSIVLDPAGVAAEVYSLAYASVIVTARASWNLK